MDRRCCVLCAVVSVALMSCTKQGLSPEIPQHGQTELLERTAELLASAAADERLRQEVYAAVKESYDAGYDEEYTFRNVLHAPSRGTGFRGTRSQEQGEMSLKDFIIEAVSSGTRSGDGAALLDSLADARVQIYWPYSQRWNGKDVPVVTFDHLGDTPWNYGFVLRSAPDGTCALSRVLIDEEYAKDHPVWVVNMNRDMDYRPIVACEDTPRRSMDNPSKLGEIIYSLMLKSFTANKNYDCWLAGASEFFIKVGAVESFTASTEAEMLLYTPTVTDFYIVVRRGEIGERKDINTILVSDWTTQMTSIAMMIIEDDGGRQTKWETEIMVKVDSKSYGIAVSIPLNVRDDIVWRGSLSSRYLFSTQAEHTVFSDVEVEMEIVETYNNSDW